MPLGKQLLVGVDAQTDLAAGRNEKRALQATTMAAIDAAARLDWDLLSRSMSDLAFAPTPDGTRN